MKKGISPIVAVVLLIAIAVIAAVGLYFWVGGLATRQPTPSTPKTITAYAVSCGSSASENTTIMIANTSPAGTSNNIKITDLQDSLGNKFNSTGSANNEWICSEDSIASGHQVACSINSTKFGAGDGTISIYGSDVASATVSC